MGRPRLAKWPALLAVGALAASAALGSAAAVEWPVGGNVAVVAVVPCRRPRLPRGVRDGAASIGRVAAPAVDLKPEDYLADLNPAQRETVLQTEGPVLVVAGAGSGKTRALTQRVAHLIATQGAKPNEILAITFTNKAAGEMRARLEDLLGHVARAIWILTFHAACGRILRREAPRLGYRSNFTIYDQADQIRLTRTAWRSSSATRSASCRAASTRRSRTRRTSSSRPRSTLKRVQSFYDQTVADVYALYQRRMLGSNAMDFDDLLMLTVEVLERFPEARKRWQKAFRYVLVDEYQDTNHAQYRLLQLLGGEHGNVCAVGDPDQCLVEGTLGHDGRRHRRSRSSRCARETRCCPATAAASSVRPP